MGKSNKNNNFVLQAGILAAAGIISRIIGLLYRGPLTNVVKDEGMGYFQGAHAMYTIVLLISSYSIPSAISKVISQKLAVREYRNAHRIFVCAIWYVLVVGSLASLFLFFGAPYLVDGPAIIVLKIFTPTIFLYGLLGVLRGYFQAHKTMVQTSISQILEQIANAVISIAAAYALIKVNMGTLEIFEDPQKNTTRAMYGAMGSALGTGAGVLVSLLFMWGIYILNKNTIHKRIERDRTKEVDSYPTILKMVSAVVMPFILSTAAYNLSTSLNFRIYIKIMQYVKNVEYAIAYADYGLFSNKAVTISNIPVAFASAMASAMIPSISQLIAQKNHREAKDKIGVSIKTTMIIAIPSAVGMGVLAKPIIQLIFPQPETVDIAAKILMALSVSVIFFSLSTLSTSILQGLGKANTSIVNAVIALVCQTITLVPLLLYTDLNQYALVLANIAYSGVLCLLNQYSVRKALGYKQEMFRTFIIPLLSSVLMGAFARVSYEGIHMLTQSNVISLIPAIVLGGCIYFVFMIALKGLTEREIKSFPKGYLLLRIAKKCKIL